LLIEFAEIYLLLNHYARTSANGITRRDKFNYIIDQYETTPGYYNLVFNFHLFIYLFLGFITREYGEQVFNRLNKYNKLLFLF
jgi:hypothetical protein